MTALPEGRAGQALAVGVGALLLAALWLIVAVPVLDWYGTRADEISFARQRLAHLQGLEASLPALRRAAATAGMHQVAGQVLLQGDSDEIAGANLQTALQGLAGQSGVSLDSVSMLPVQPLGGLRRIGVDVSLATTWPDLVALLAAIDAATPRLMVDDLTVTAAQPVAGQEVPLQASFDVSGFRAGGAR